MGREKTRQALADCAMGECSFHALGSGCRVATGLPPADAPLLLRAGGGIEQVSCALLDAMARAFGGPRGDALGRLFLLLERVAGQARDGEVGLSYLLRCVSADRVDAIRRESGRARCGACSAYGWSSRRCLARDTPYIDELRPDTEPSQLTPACTSFRSVHAAGADPEVLDRPSSGNRAVSERVLGALEILERSDATAAALLVEHYLSGRSLRDVSRATGVARRRLTAELRRAERLLGAILEDLP